MKCFFLSVIGLCFTPISSISSKKCSNSPYALECEFNNFKPLNDEDIQSFKFCFQLEDSFKDISVNLLNGSVFNSIAYLGKTLFKDGSNEVVFTIHKYQSNRNKNDYLYNTSVNQASTNTSSGLLKNIVFKGEKIVLRLQGKWSTYAEFKSTTPSHSTNCPTNDAQSISTTPKTIYAITPIQCNKSHGISILQTDNQSSTICSFDSSLLFNLGKESKTKICFKPERFFESVSVVAYIEALPKREATNILSAKNVLRNEWNEIELLINPRASDGKLSLIFEGQTALRPLKNFQSKKKLALLFKGEWDGTRNFHYENISLLTNCSENKSQTILIYVLGAVILTFVVVAFGIIFLRYQKNKNSKDAAKASEILHDRLSEVTDSTLHVAVAKANIQMALDDEPYYSNVTFHGKILDETEDVTYLELDFKDAKKRNGDLKNHQKKNLQNFNKLKRPQPETKEEVVYASIEPEVIPNNENVAYANVGDYFN